MNAVEQHKIDILFSHLGSVEDKIIYGDKQFYMSLLWQHENKKTSALSPSQMYHLERLYDKYSMEEIQKQEEFEKNYGKEQRKIAIQCAQYYNSQHPPYFDRIVSKVLDDPEGHTLSRTEYNKMCANKYTLKILACYKEEQKFQVGEFVQVRTTNRLDVANTNQKDGHRPRGRAICRQLANKHCIILEANSKPITRAAKGSRVYKILIMGEAQPVYAHESDLKKSRRIKK